MGCDCSKSRPVSQEEEQTIQEYEETLGFSQISASKFLQVLNEVERGTRLSKVQFLELLAKASLKECDQNDQAHPLTKFYTWLKTDQFWSAKKLIALSLLLSPGSFDKKLEVLIDAYDSQKTRMLSSKALESFLRDACLISLQLLPSMVEAMLFEHGLASLGNRVSIYRRKLEMNCEETVMYLKAELIGADEREVSEETLRSKELIMKQTFASKDLREMTINFWRFRKSNAFQRTLMQKQINLDSMLASS